MKKSIIDRLRSYARTKRVAGIGGRVHPSVYVGTYAKYNNGSIYGAWVDLTKFDTYEDFLNYIYKLHKDERDPEFMIQDFEGFPESWYSETMLPDEDMFNRIKDYYEFFDGDEERQAAYDIITEWSGEPISIDEFNERYLGTYNSEYDYIDEMIEEGVLVPQDWGSWVYDRDAIWQYLDTSGDVEAQSSDYGVVIFIPSNI
mgnify:CR=1 FL=1